MFSLHFPIRLTNDFLGAAKHLYNWLCLSVGLLVGRLVGRVTHSFHDPHIAPYWPTWPCFSIFLIIDIFDDEKYRFKLPWNSMVAAGNCPMHSLPLLPIVSIVE